MTINEVAGVFDTILSIPGMNDTIKLDLKISRRNVLLLNSVIHRGLNLKDADDPTSTFLNVMPKKALQELSEISNECLRKAGLTELSDKLKGLKGGK